MIISSKFTIAIRFLFSASTPFTVDLKGAMIRIPHPVHLILLLPSKAWDRCGGRKLGDDHNVVCIRDNPCLTAGFLRDDASFWNGAYFYWPWRTFLFQMLAFMAAPSISAITHLFDYLPSEVILLTGQDLVPMSQFQSNEGLSLFYFSLTF